MATYIDRNCGCGRRYRVDGELHRHVFLELFFKKKKKIQIEKQAKELEIYK